MNNIKVLTLV